MPKSDSEEGPLHFVYCLVSVNEATQQWRRGRDGDGHEIYICRSGAARANKLVWDLSLEPLYLTIEPMRSIRPTHVHVAMAKHTRRCRYRISYCAVNQWQDPRPRNVHNYMPSGRLPVHWGAIDQSNAYVWTVLAVAIDIYRDFSRLASNSASRAWVVLLLKMTTVKAGMIWDIAFCVFNTLDSHYCCLESVESCIY